MKPKFSKNRALSTVLTTVIILVASVVLGSGVVLYGASLFQGGTQQESISVSGVKVWVHSTEADGLAWGAAGVRNTGDKVISVDKIQIRGADIPFTQWYPDLSITPSLFQKALNHTGWSNTNGMMSESDPDEDCADATYIPATSIQADLDGAGGEDAICANAGSGPVSLTPGSSTVIYFKLTNGTLSSLDSGVNTSVNIFAGKTGAPQSVTVQGKS